MANTIKISAQEALVRTIEHREIFHDEMLHIVRQIMGGNLSPVMMAALITGLRVKKETIGEITAAAQVMREFATPVAVSPAAVWKALTDACVAAPKEAPLVVS